MSRQQLTRSFHIPFARPAGRRGLAMLAGVAAILVIAAIAIVTVGPTVTGSDESAMNSSGESGAFGGGTAPAYDGGALRAPEEARGYDDAKGVPEPSAMAQSATDGVSTGGTSGVPLPSIDAGRTIIRSAGIDISVTAVADAFEQIRQVATALGGYVGDSSFSGSGEHQTAYLTLRVPSDRFGDAIAQIRGLAAEVQSISTGARDVTGEYSDVEATLRNLRAVEQQYVALLGRAGSIGDILQVQDRLNQVRLEIDRMEARRQLLASQADLATITVSLRPVGVDGPVVSDSRGPLDAAADAWQSSLATLATLATAVLVVTVYSWWIVPPVLVLAYFARRWWRRQAPTATPALSD